MKLDTTFSVTVRVEFEHPTEAKDAQLNFRNYFSEEIGNGLIIETLVGRVYEILIKFSTSDRDKYQAYQEANIDNVKDFFSI